MLSVGKINTNITFRSNKLYEQKLNSFGNSVEARRAYYEMNKDVYVDYVDGDVSLAKRVFDKLSDFWHILHNEDPRIETKAKIIEASLRNPF